MEVKKKKRLLVKVIRLQKGGKTFCIRKETPSIPIITARGENQIN